MTGYEGRGLMRERTMRAIWWASGTFSASTAPM